MNESRMRDKRLLTVTTSWSSLTSIFCSASNERRWRAGWTAFVDEPAPISSNESRRSTTAMACSAL